MLEYWYMDKKDIKEQDFDFDLPAVESAPMNKPRIHMAGDSTCVSCEG
jgi:hypothetical protein